MSKVEVTVHSTGDSLEAAVDDDIREFESWFQGLGNDPLTKAEKSILKTYLWKKTKGAQNA